MDLVAHESFSKSDVNSYCSTNDQTCSFCSVPDAGMFDWPVSAQIGGFDLQIMGS